MKKDLNSAWENVSSYRARYYYYYDDDGSHPTDSLAIVAESNPLLDTWRREEKEKKENLPKSIGPAFADSKGG